MASTNPKKKDKFQLSNVPVVLEWRDDDDDEYRHLGHTLPLTLDAKLDVANATASLKLRVVLSLRGAGKRVPFYLFIPPDRVAGVVADGADAPLRQPVVDTLLGTRRKSPTAATSPADILRLRFALLLEAPPAIALVGPAPSPPLPQTGPSARALDALRALVRPRRRSSSSSSSLSLHLPRPSVPDGFVEALCANAKPGRLFPVPRERGSLYSGRGGREVEWPSSSPPPDGNGGGGGGGGGEKEDDDDWLGGRGGGGADAEAESPPSYDELGVLPEPRERRRGEGQVERGRAAAAAMAGRKRGKSSARSSPSDCEDRRPRKKVGGFTNASDGVDKKTALEIAGYDWSRGVDGRVALLSEQLEALKKVVGSGAAATAAAATATTPSTVAEDETSESATAADPTRVADDNDDDVCTRLARLEAEMAAVRADVAAANTRWEGLAQQLREQGKEDMEQLREQGKEDLEDMRWSIMEDMEELLARSRDEVVDEAECRMEDRFLSAKEELREGVEEECENAEERIKELLSSGAAGVYFEFPKS